MSKGLVHNVLPGAFIAKPPLQMTKITKIKTITRGQNGKKTKKVTKEVKKSKAGQVNSVTEKGNFACCENSQPTKFCRLQKFRSPALFLSSALCFFFSSGF